MSRPFCYGNRSQPEATWIDAGAHVTPGPADVRCRHQCSIELVSPTVVRAHDSWSAVHGGLDEQGSPVAAHIVKYAQCRAIAPHQQGLAENGNRVQIPFCRNIGRKANTKPRLLEEGTALEIEHRLVGEMTAGQSLVTLQKSGKILG